MRVSTVAQVLLAATPAVVSAAGSLGFALGTKVASGDCKTQQDYEGDLDAIESASGSKIVRGYAASDCDAAKGLMPAAEKKGFKVILGIWPDVEESYKEDLAAIKSVVGKYSESIYAVTVGSETLYRDSLSGQELLNKIKEVKSELGGDIKVGTADSWNKFQDGTGNVLLGNDAVDILLINAFAFWQGDQITNSSHRFFDDIMQAFSIAQAKSGSLDKPELWVGETGWPTDGGSSYKAAKAGTQNAATFYRQGLCGMLAWGVNAFFFEAFDEPWKPDSIGDNGIAANEKHWGAMTSDRKSKFSLKC